MKIEIDRPTASQCDEIRSLLAKTIRHTFESEDVADSHASELDSEVHHQWKMLARDLKSGGVLEYFLIAKIDRKIVGTIAYGPPNQIIKDNLQIDHNRTPEIKSVYMLPEFQGRGVGSALFDRMVATLEDHTVDRFSLDSGYRKAQQFWIKKLGEPTVVLRDYWCPDGHHMIWHRDVADLMPR